MARQAFAELTRFASHQPQDEAFNGCLKEAGFELDSVYPLLSWRNPEKFSVHMGYSYEVLQGIWHQYPEQVVCIVETQDSGPTGTLL